MTPEQRHELIYRPFLITYLGSSYPWGGIAVADTFGEIDSTTTEWAHRSAPTNGTPDDPSGHSRPGMITFHTRAVRNDLVRAIARSTY